MSGKSDPNETTHPGAAGEVIAQRYLVLDLIASGANGSVYKVRHTEIGKVFALKTLKVTKRTSESALLRLQREARALSKITHPNIIRVHSLAEDEQSGFVMVMDYLEGITLKEALTTKGALPVADALSITRDICAGLSAAHEQGVLHRDLKPSNIMLVDSDSGPRALLIDFGLAKIVADQQKLTQTEALLGTPAYMSPEQGRGNNVDHRSDIYTAGCILFEMLAGHRPFDADTSFAIMMKHLEEEPPALARDDVPEPLRLAIASILNKAMAKLPENRYQTAAEMGHEIDATMRGDTKSTSRLASATKVPPKHRGLIAISVVVFTLGIAAVTANLGWLNELLPEGDPQLQFEKSFAKAILHKDADQARKLAERFVATAHEGGKPRDEIAGLMALAEASNLKSETRTAVPNVYATARKIATANKFSLFDIDMAEADYYYWLNEPAQMTALYRKWLTKPEDERCGFIIAYRLADRKFTEGELEEAAQLLNIAKSRAKTASEDQLFAGLQGSILVFHGKPKEGHDLLQVAVGGNLAETDRLELSRFYTHLAAACQKLGDYREAGDLTAKARRQLKSIQPGQEGRAEMIRGEVWRLLVGR